MNSRQVIVITALAAMVLTGFGSYDVPSDHVMVGMPSLVCKPQSSHLPEVGELKKIVSDNVYLGKNLLESNSAPLFTNSTLCTDDEGQVKFLVEPLKRTTCEMDPNSRVRLYPPKKNPKHRRVVIRFEAGGAWCGTGEDEDDLDEKFDADGGRVRLFMNDPLFAVDVNATRTVAKVKLGYIEVSRRAGEGAVIVGPEQQVTVPAGGKPQPVEPIDLTAKDEARFAGLASEVPKPDFGRPVADGSSTLKRVFRRKVLSVGLAADLVTDNGTQPFVRSFAGFLAKSWRLKLRLLNLKTPEWVTGLETGNIDLAISTDKRRLSQFDTFPLFADARGAVWHVGIVQDKHFLNSLRSFLITTVNSGDYGSFYRSSFKTEPSYGPLSPVLFG